MNHSNLELQQKKSPSTKKRNQSQKHISITKLFSIRYSHIFIFTYFVANQKYQYQSNIEHG